MNNITARIVQSPGGLAVEKRDEQGNLVSTTTPAITPRVSPCDFVDTGISRQQAKAIAAFLNEQGVTDASRLADMLRRASKDDGII